MHTKLIFRSIFIIIILGLAVYYNSLNGKFVWDDDPLVKDNLRIRSFRNLPEIFTEEIGKGAGNEYNFYRPFQILSNMVDYSLWRLRPQGYHLTNILLHVFVALAICWLVSILYNDHILSLLTAVFFTVHPVHTEVVAYISGRADSLAALFMLLCLAFYITHIRSNKISYYTFALLSYLLALLSRENALILPLLLLLFHYTFGVRLNGKRFLPILCIALFYIALRATFLGSTLPDVSGHPLLMERLPAFFAAMTNYTRLLFIPSNLHMEYGNRLFSFTDTKAITGILIVAALVIFIIKKRRTKGLAFFSIAWFLVALLPVSHLYPLNAYMAEHWLYLPSIGYFLILASILRRILRAKGAEILAIFLISVLLLFYSYLTICQNNYWKEPVAFYKKTLEYSPYSLKLYNNLGMGYIESGRHEEAIKVYQDILGVEPGYVYAHFNIGFAYEAVGRREEAIASYRRAIEIDPDYSRPYNNLGTLYTDAGRNDEAIALYKKAIEIDPDYKDPYYNLGNEYRRTGRHKEAIESYKRAIEIDPYDAATHNNLAVTYYHDNQYDFAIRHCDRAIELGCRVHPEFFDLLRPYR